ncbi:hypothetical protein NKJ23_13745 [Mesorhizobium sp. M0184]|uniref:hypothetical protein n=1 Tax=Mesorhizobium sp. M0184 TaxID=2956906 RepID=UPI0033383C9C
MDLDQWHIEFRHDSPQDIALGRDREPEVFKFSKAVDLAKFLADDTNDDAIRFHSFIDDKLDANTDVAVWRRKRTKLSSLPQFKRYRANEYESYHQAARSVANGQPASKEVLLFQGLEKEICGSSIIIPSGQVLFHGKASRDLTSMTPYPSFISATLHPVVARNSAFRRAGVDNQLGYPILYVLTVGLGLPALWGHVGGSAEWELLLPSSLTVVEKSEYSGRNFLVIEAEITKRG